ncbi:MAG: hypothetical protein C0393_02175 [Anaerolinea sp.]|nr:hypothetical protein [Anaerolinea sp.]
MFDAITFKNSMSPGPLIDIGALAEALLFYDRVAIVGNTRTLKEILHSIPPLVLLSLFRDERLEFYYLADQIGVSATRLSNGRLLHDLVRISSPDHTIEKVGSKAFFDAPGGTSHSKIFANGFASLLRSFDHSAFDQELILETILDNQTTEQQVFSLIRKIVPSFSISDKLYFRIERENKGFYVDTNIDFNQLNDLYHQAVMPSHSTLSEAHLLMLIQNAYEATFFAGALNTEVAVHPIERAIQAKVIEDVVQRHVQSQEQIGKFADLTLANCHAIREAVNAGAVPFQSVVKLLDKADKFRVWLHEQPPDANLVHTYYEATVKDSWVERLPAKTTRWSIFTGIGFGLDMLGAGGLGTAAGVAVSAIDSFLLDKLTKGWKPHQFVESDLKSLFKDSRSN